MRPLRTEDLNNILRKNSVTANTYLGAFPACVFPKTEKKCYSWISNTDVHGRSGKHWIAWFVNDDKVCFFDSYGRAPDDPTLPINFRTFADNFKVIQFSGRRVQRWNSVACGYFCIHFIYVLSLGLDYSSFLKDYSRSNFEANDYFAVNFVNSII